MNVHRNQPAYDSRLGLSYARDATLLTYRLISIPPERIQPSSELSYSRQARRGGYLSGASRLACVPMRLELHTEIQPHSKDCLACQSGRGGR